MIGSVVGIGMVSPLGLTPADHVFFRRVSLPPRSPACFVDPDDKRINVAHCACLGGRAPLVERIVWKARAACATALLPMRLAGGPAPALMLCLSSPRPGFGKDHALAVERAIVSALRPASTRVFHGAASAFVALQEAGELLSKDPASAVLIVGADSFVDLESVTHDRANPPSPWAVEPPPLAEGAAAIAVMHDGTARRMGVRVMATIIASTVAHGASNDDNDEPADGVGLGVAIRAMPGGDPVGILFGQSGVDVSRMYECHYATARTAKRFRPDCLFDCVEVDSGRVGAAAGAMNVAYGVVATDTHAIPSRLDGTPFMAWAISRDGTRGLALCAPGKR